MPEERDVTESRWPLLRLQLIQAPRDCWAEAMQRLPDRLAEIKLGAGGRSRRSITDTSRSRCRAAARPTDGPRRHAVHGHGGLNPARQHTWGWLAGSKRGSSRDRARRDRVVRRLG